MVMTAVFSSFTKNTIVKNYWQKYYCHPKDKESLFIFPESNIIHYFETVKIVNFPRKILRPEM